VEAGVSLDRVPAMSIAAGWGLVLGSDMLTRFGGKSVYAYSTDPDHHGDGTATRGTRSID